MEDHPLDGIAAKFDQAFAARPLRGEQQNARIDFPHPLREARRIERAGDQQQGIRLPAKRTADDGGDIDVGPRLECHRHDLAAAPLEFRGEIAQPALAIGSVLRVMNRHHAPHPALREVIFGTQLRFFLGARHDQKKIVVAPEEMAGSHRRTDQHDIRLLGNRQNNLGHGAGHRPDNGLDPRADQLIDRGNRLFGILGVVPDDQLDLTAVDAARAIDLLDRNLRPVAPGLAEIGNATAEPAEEADAHRFTRAATADEAEYQQESGCPQHPRSGLPAPEPVQQIILIHRQREHHSLPLVAAEAPQGL